MICQGHPAESYGLYVLDALEEPEASEIREHVADNCPTCMREIRAYSAVWCLTASAIAHENQAAPPAGLRGRVLQVAQAVPFIVRKRAPVGTWVWASGMAAAILICAAGWSVGRFRADGMTRELESQHATLDLSQRNEQQWRQRAEEAERRLASVQTPPAAVANPVQAVPSVPRVNSETSAELAKAQSEIRALTESLSHERAPQTALAAELNSQKGLLTAALLQKDDLERRAQGAADDASKRADLESRLAGLSARVQQLTRENSTYRETVDSLTRQMDKNTQLVSFLSSDSLKTVRLRPTEAGGKSSGQAFIVDGQKVVFYAAGLPRLATGRVYQLWLLRGKNPEIVSGGVFRPQGDQRITIEFANRSLTADINGVAVTEEPEGGSSSPTGHKLLVGTSKS